MKKILLIFIILFIGISCFKIYNKITIIDLPKGELQWSNEKPQNAKLCIPAAFSSTKNTIVGVHKINGTSYGCDKKYKISLINDTFVIDRSWQSDNGFQQIILVKDNTPVKFKGSTKKCIRRALCKNNNNTFLIESNYPMTMNSFANYCNKYCSDAVYLDMGEYGYGYIKKGFIKKHLYLLSYLGKHKQTNWLYIL
jgi:hypothetical protein